MSAVDALHEGQLIPWAACFLQEHWLAVMSHENPQALLAHAAQLSAPARAAGMSLKPQLRIDIKTAGAHAMFTLKGFQRFLGPRNWCGQCCSVASQSWLHVHSIQGNTYSPRSGLGSQYSDSK